MEEIDLTIAKITELENHIDDLILEEVINGLEEQARAYSMVATTTLSNKKEFESLEANYHQIIRWLRELQKYRKMYSHDRTSNAVD